MTGRRGFLAAFAAAPWIARAGTEPRRKRLAIFIPGPREKTHPHYVKAFVPLLAEHGWIEGRTVELRPVFTAVGDPVGSGFAKSLARPGGNITGLSLGLSEIGAKQVELLRAVLPKLSSVVVLGGSRSRAIEEIAEPFITAAKGARIATNALRITSLAQAESAMRALPGGVLGAIPGLRAQGVQAAIFASGTTNALGLKLPPEILVRADEVYE